MVARIYRPARTAMQSGSAKTKTWLLEYEPSEPRRIEPLMGWTSSGDMASQIRLHFASRDEAVAYAERHGLAYRVEEERAPTPKTMAYSDNFRSDRPEPWTH